MHIDYDNVSNLNNLEVNNYSIEEQAILNVIKKIHL